MPDTSRSPSCPPWWRHPLVWMIIGGPALVVVAGIATFVIAVRSPDPVVAQDSDRLKRHTDRTLSGDARKGMLPAQQGRNHAASPGPAR